MRVGLVLHPFGSQQKGLEQYIFESARSMTEGDGKDISYTVFVKGRRDVSGLSGREIVHLPDVPWWHLHLLLASQRIDTFVFFTESAPLLLWKKSIVVFFDAAYWYFFKKTPFSRIKRRMLIWWRRRMLAASLHVVTISESSKRDLVEKLGLRDDHITVIYPGFKATHAAAVASLKPAIPYFMFVGPMKERKNALAIIEAFTRFKKRTEHPHELLIVGRMSGSEYEKRVMEAVEGSGQKDTVKFKTNVEDEALSGLYTHADALLYPSLLEGFGLPILEALSHGCMVITSRTTSTKEALGDAGILVDPKDVEEIVEAMIRVAERAYDRERFLRDAAIQSTRFSWEASRNMWVQVIRTHGKGKDVEHKTTA